MSIRDPRDTWDRLPRNRREARKWVREHWAALIRAADMGAVADLESDMIDDVWSDECQRIAERLSS
jgi:hypothetical protein